MPVPHAKMAQTQVSLAVEAEEEVSISSPTISHERPLRVYSAFHQPSP